MTAAAQVEPPKIERTPARLWLVRDTAGQPVYCGPDAMRAQKERARLMPVPVAAGHAERPDHPHGDPGPRAAARGPLELAEIIYDYGGGRGPAFRTSAKVVRRQSQGMRCLSPLQRQVLEVYAAKVESLASVSTVPLDGGKGGARSADAVKLERAWRSIRIREIRCDLRQVVVPVRMRGQADRPPGRPITLLALVEGVAIWRRSLCEVLSDHGWPRADRAKRRLGRALREAADQLAGKTGLD